MKWVNNDLKKKKIRCRNSLLKHVCLLEKKKKKRQTHRNQSPSDKYYHFVLPGNRSYRIEEITSGNGNHDIIHIRCNRFSKSQPNGFWRATAS